MRSCPNLLIKCVDKAAQRFETYSKLLSEIIRRNKPMLCIDLINTSLYLNCVFIQSS